MSKYKTWIDGHPRVETGPLYPTEVYNTPEEVPMALRQAFRVSYASGLTTHHLAIIYDLPEEWIAGFIAEGWAGGGREVS